MHGMFNSNNLSGWKDKSIFKINFTQIKEYIELTGWLRAHSWPVHSPQDETSVALHFMKYDMP